MLEIVSETLAKLRAWMHLGRKNDALDPLVEKMRDLTWQPTEDDRSALKYQVGDGEGGKGRAPLAEMMAANYLGHPTEPFDNK